MKYYDGDTMIRYEIDSDGDGYFDIINESSCHLTLECTLIGGEYTCNDL